MNACPECGSETIHKCPACEEEIRGSEYSTHSNVISGDAARVEDYCSECGEPFPWENKVAEGFAALDPDEVDPRLREKAIPQFEDGHYEDAVKAAFVVLEERLRELGEFEQTKSRTQMANEGLNPDGGALAFGKTRPEKLGVMSLYKGVFLAVRNPSNHRFVEPDEAFARDALHTVNLLVRMLEENNG